MERESGGGLVFYFLIKENGVSSTTATWSETSLLGEATTTREREREREKERERERVEL